MQLTLPPGSHTIEVSTRGHEPQRRDIQCAYGRPLFVAFSFSRSGRLAVRTSVEGVEIKLDGEVVGYSPFEGEVSPGRHVVDLTLYGYEPVRREVVVTPGAAETLSERMRRLQSADAVDIRRDGANPFAGDATRSPPAAPEAPQPPPPAAAAGRPRYYFGAFGGLYTAAVGSDSGSEGAGGFIAGIQSVAPAPRPGGRGVCSDADCHRFPAPLVPHRCDCAAVLQHGHGVLRLLVRARLGRPG